MEARPCPATCILIREDKLFLDVDAFGLCPFLYFLNFSFKGFGHPAKVSDVASRFSSLLQQSKAHVEFELPEGQLPEGQFLVDHLPHTCTICILYTYLIIFIFILYPKSIGRSQSWLRFFG